MFCTFHLVGRGFEAKDQGIRYKTSIRHCTFCMYWRTNYKEKSMYTEQKTFEVKNVIVSKGVRKLIYIKMEKCLFTISKIKIGQVL